LPILFNFQTYFFLLKEIVSFQNKIKRKAKNKIMKASRIGEHNEMALVLVLEYYIKIKLFDYEENKSPSQLAIC
jgi:hypothetical protein